MNTARNNAKMPQTTDRAALLEKIRALDFVKVELELYLDTHPTCKAALDYYYQTIDALREMTHLYESMYGPLTAMGNVDTERWTWVNGPWPWQRADEQQDNGWEGKK